VPLFHHIILAEELKVLDRAFYSFCQFDWQGRQLWQRFVKLSVSAVDGGQNTTERFSALYQVNSLTCKPKLFP
jgi:hypothetical protein